MMNLISSIQEISNRVRWRRVNNGRRDNVWHVAVVTIPWNLEFWIGIELPDRCKMYITTTNISFYYGKRREYLPKYCYTNRLLGSYGLKFAYKVVPFILMVLRSPVVVKVIENFNTSI